MAFMFAVLCALAAAAYASPQFAFAYDVSNPQNSDFRGSRQTRQSDAYEGTYTFVDPAGVKRTIRYSSDGKNGFKAMVDQDPDAKEDNKTTTPPPKPKEKPEDDKKKEDDEQKDKNVDPNVRLVPVPVYPPVLSRGAFPYAAPYWPNPGYNNNFRNPGGYRGGYSYSGSF